MVSIEIIVDTHPESADLEGFTTYKVQRPTEDEAAIAMLAIMTAIYGKHLKQATSLLSELLAAFPGRGNEET